MKNYISDHFSGRHSVSRSLFVNSGAVYIALLLVLLLISWIVEAILQKDPPTYLFFLIFGVIYSWSLIGLFRSCVNNILNNPKIIVKVYAVAVLIAFAAALVVSGKDVASMITTI